jgi:hypothetical protein
MERNKSGLNEVMEFSNTEQLRINGVKKHCLRKKIFFNLFSTKCGNGTFHVPRSTWNHFSIFFY